MSMGYFFLYVGISIVFIIVASFFSFHSGANQVAKRANEAIEKIFQHSTMAMIESTTDAMRMQRYARKLEALLVEHGITFENQGDVTVVGKPPSDEKLAI